MKMGCNLVLLLYIALWSAAGLRPRSAFSLLVRLRGGDATNSTASADTSRPTVHNSSSAYDLRPPMSANATIPRKKKKKKVKRRTNATKANLTAITVDGTQASVGKTQSLQKHLVEDTVLPQSEKVLEGVPEPVIEDIVVPEPIIEDLVVPDPVVEDGSLPEPEAEPVIENVQVPEAEPEPIIEDVVQAEAESESLAEVVVAPEAESVPHIQMIPERVLEESIQVEEIVQVEEEVVEEVMTVSPPSVVEAGFAIRDEVSKSSESRPHVVPAVIVPPMSAEEAAARATAAEVASTAIPGPARTDAQALAIRSLGRAARAGAVTLLALALAIATTSSPIISAVTIGATLGAAFRTLVCLYFSAAFFYLARANRKAAASTSTPPVMSAASPPSPQQHMPPSASSPVAPF